LEFLFEQDAVAAGAAAGAPFGGGGSYTSSKDDWEVAIIKGDKDKWEITYDTPITNDVLGYQTKEDINKLIVTVLRF